MEYSYKKEHIILKYSIFYGTILLMEKESTIRELKRRIKELEQESVNRKIAEDLLSKERAYLDQLFENAQEAIVMCDNYGKVLRVNSEFTQSFGYTNEEATGKEIDHLIASEELLKDAADITNHVTDGHRVALEAKRITGAGVMKREPSILQTGFQREKNTLLREISTDGRTRPGIKRSRPMRTFWSFTLKTLEETTIWLLSTAVNGQKSTLYY